MPSIHPLGEIVGAGKLCTNLLGGHVFVLVEVLMQNRKQLMAGRRTNNGLMGK